MTYFGPKKRVRAYGPRFREQGTQVPSTLGYTLSYNKYVAGYPTSGSLGVGSYGGFYSSMQDVVTKDYKRLIRAGFVVNNPMSRMTIESWTSQIDSTTQSTVSPTGYQLTRRWYGDGVGKILGPLVSQVKSVNFGTYPDPPGMLTLDAAMRSVSTICWKNVNAPSSLSLVSLAEAHKSFALIHGNARKLANVIQLWKANAPWRTVKAYLGLPDLQKAPRPDFMPVWTPTGTVRTKRGKVEGVWAHQRVTDQNWRLLDEPTRRWLEWRYGWNPLIKDIVDHMKAVTLPEPWRERKRHTARANSKDKKSSRTVPTIPNKDGGTWTYESVIDAEVSVKGYVIWELDPGNPFLRLNDFGLFDLPRTILELVPYSFVAEWIVQTDDFLQAWQPKIGVNIVASGAVVSAKKTITRQVLTYVMTPGPAGGTWPNPPIPLGSGDKVISRIKSRVVPLPLPDRPIVDVKINAKRLVDAFALMRGSINRSTTRL